VRPDPQLRPKERADAQLRIAVLSIHSSPVGELGTSDTGGMSVYVRELARELGRRGHRVDIFTRERTTRTAPVVQLLPGVRLVHLRGGVNGHHERSGLYPHLPRFFESLEEFCSLDGARYDLVHSHYWLSGRMGTWAQERWGVPHVVMFHTLGAVKNSIRCGEEEPEIRIAEEADVALRCDRIVAPTTRERDYIVEFCGASAQKVALIPCGVSLERFRPTDRAGARELLGMDPGEAVLLYVGRFAPVKGLERLLEAMAHLKHHPRLRLVVVGGDGPEGPQTDRLRSRIRELGVEAVVIFAGRVDQQDLPPFYSAADLLVVPSYYESFGLVALEALACGTPVVATRVGAMESILADAECGALVSEPDPQDLARGIDAVLIRARCAPVPRERIRASVSRYTWSSVASAIAVEYAALLGGSTRSKDDERFCHAAAQ
jgi:D-inositol-3-phosphate glycosyltransferase